MMMTSTLASPIVTAGCRPVIINVDDLGLSDAVNEAVIALAKLGRVHSSSYMSGGSISAEHLASIKRLNIQIGLHLDFTGIYPSAIKDSLSGLIISSYLKRLDEAAVTAIIERQLDEFEATFAHPPVFVDGHQHVHQFPVIRQSLAKVLSQRYYNPQSKQVAVASRVTTPLVYDVKSWIIYMLGGQAWQRLCDQQNIPTNSKFGGVYNFKATEDQLASLWANWFSHCPLTSLDLPNPPAPALIMCHPAKPNDSWQDEIKAAREIEYQWLMSDAFSALCDAHNIEIVGWRH